MCVNLVVKLSQELEGMALAVQGFDSPVWGRRLRVFGFALAESVWFPHISVGSHNYDCGGWRRRS
jgi:hypothetical protein